MRRYQRLLLGMLARISEPGTFSGPVAAARPGDVTEAGASPARPSGRTVGTCDPGRARAELRPVAGFGPDFRVVVGSDGRGVTQVA
ncbi:hypothetical protein [Streptomyces sp. NPDC052225]|uniref:hypothetical protein n=1 Tax=Streptomyces sp. NPDC052225 TaxID=3154949 RepID=UPI003445C956